MLWRRVGWGLLGATVLIGIITSLVPIGRRQSGGRASRASSLDALTQREVAAGDSLDTLRRLVESGQTLASLAAHAVLMESVLAREGADGPLARQLEESLVGSSEAKLTRAIAAHLLVLVNRRSACHLLLQGLHEGTDDLAYITATSLSTSRKLGQSGAKEYWCGFFNGPEFRVLIGRTYFEEVANTALSGIEIEHAYGFFLGHVKPWSRMDPDLRLALIDYVRLGIDHTSRMSFLKDLSPGQDLDVAAYATYCNITGDRELRMRCLATITIGGHPNSIQLLKQALPHETQPILVEQISAGLTSLARTESQRAEASEAIASEIPRLRQAGRIDAAGSLLRNLSLLDSRTGISTLWVLTTPTSDESTRCQALAALAHVYTGSPTMADRTRIVAECLSDESVRVRSCAWKSISGLLSLARSTDLTSAQLAAIREAAQSVVTNSANDALRTMAEAIVRRADELHRSK